jgi:hypothetical protein
VYMYDTPSAKPHTQAIFKAGQDDFWEATEPEVALL